MPAPENTYALILAGGSGTRFWPLSRDAKPKQLLQLFGSDTLLEQAVRRLDGMVPPENILILTNAEQEVSVRMLMGERIPAENIVAEPAKRDTAPAIALGIGWVAARCPDAVMMVLPADQLIQQEESFRECLAGAVEVAARTSALVTVGIRPTWPCPSYGYIERGRRAFISGLQHSPALYEVVRFREKPNPDLAEEFLRAGTFTWNAGMFIWSVPAVMAELAAHCPELARFVSEIKDSRDLAASLAAQFGSLPKISIDYALMEKAGRVLNVEASFDWDDVGSWISVAKYLPQDNDRNAANEAVSQLDSAGNIVFNTTGKRIALLGVKDLIVVETDDAVLVADKNCADAIKNLVDLVPPELH
jgi:mannose-1-phosphate guanylyltransferase